MEFGDDDAIKQKKKKSSYLFKMIGVLFCLVFCNWLLGNISLSLPNADPQLKRLFTPNIPVRDIYNGSMDSLETMLQAHPITVVMFYAPWSGQSQKYGNVIKQLANILAKRKVQINIVAINCWVGTCRNVFPTPYFPRIFLYHTTYLPIEFLENIDLQKLIKFLRLSIRPYIYIGNELQLKRFLAIYDSTVIAYMDRNYIGSKSKRFNIYFQTALEVINKVNIPRFGILLDKFLASKVGLYYHGQIVRKVYNQKDLFFSHSEYTPSKIKEWFLLQSRMLVSVLTPTHTNIQHYLSTLKNGPIIVLFISPWLTRQYSQILSDFHQSASMYYQCKCPQTVLKMSKTLCMTSITSPKTICSLCQHTTLNINSFDEKFVDMLREDSMALDLPFYCYCYSSGYSKILFTKCCFKMLPELEDILNKENNYDIEANNIIINNNVSNYTNFHDTMNLSLKLMQDEDENEISTSKLKNMLRKKLNEVLYKQQQVNLKPAHQVFTSSSSNEKTSKENICGKKAPCCTNNKLDTLYSFNGFKGLACRTNKTLSFHEMDSLEYNYLMKSFGIQDENIILIVHPLTQEYYKFDINFTFHNLATFIINYTFGLLQHKSLSSIHNSRMKKTVENATHSGVVSIKELNSTNFLSVVMDVRKNVFVLFYTSWCGVCKSVNYRYLRLLQQYHKRNEVFFTRINGDTHDLPYGFKTNSYPAFLLFPAYNKHLSVAFPKDLEYNQSKFKKKH